MAASVRKVRDHLSKYLRRVQQGEEVVITLVFPQFCGHRKKSCSPLQGCALELGGAKVAQGRVAALSIVKDFYIFE